MATWAGSTWSSWMAAFIFRIAVVLPPPEGPTRQQMVPAGTVSESRSMAGRSYRG